MGIEKVSMDLAQTRVQSAFGTALLSKELGVGETQANEVVEMVNPKEMELSVNPTVGANFDVSV